MPPESLAGQFPSTEWTLVLAAGADTSRAAPALEQLCRAYWQPLYAFARRRGHSPEFSEDAVQGFLLTVIERSSIGNVEREGGRFRSWLLGGFVNHLTNLHRHQRTQRRGGGLIPIAIEDAEPALPADPALTPDEAYDRRWAQLVFDKAVARLAEQQQRGGKGDALAVLLPVITAQAKTPHAELAEQLGINSQAVTVQIHRLRQRLRELVRAEIARTVLTARDLEEEFSYLIKVLQRK